MKKYISLIIILLVLLCLTLVTKLEDKNNIVKITKKVKVSDEASISCFKDSKQSLYDKKEVINRNKSQALEIYKAKAEKPKEIQGFVLLKSLDPDFIIDLRYSTTNNFTKQKVYPNDICVLKKSTADKLEKANKEFKKLGYRIKIWDAYRPLSVQKIFWSIVPNNDYVANPYAGGSIHNKGCAVDITLVDKNSKEIEMPSDFDDFTDKASRNNNSISPAAQENLNLLTKVMTECGFTTINSEWWHFNDTDSDRFKIEDVDLNLFSMSIFPIKNSPIDFAIEEFLLSFI